MTIPDLGTLSTSGLLLIVLLIVSQAVDTLATDKLLGIGLLVLAYILLVVRVYLQQKGWNIGGRK